MNRIKKYIKLAFSALCFLFISSKAQAQDLDPRAYVRVPVRTNIIGAGFGFSDGSVITDASLPLKDVSANIKTLSVVVGHSFNMFGKTAQFSVAQPFAWAKASGTIGEQVKTAERTGFGDMRLRCSILLAGAPAATKEELAKEPIKTVIGASVTVVAPVGQYFPEKLINLGTHRWSVKPELALSQPFGKRWLLDLYAGVWLFTDNNTFYPGNSLREQNPMGSFQMHLSYNIKPGFWAALNGTYYTGGNSTVNGLALDDRQDNSRIGGTLVVPVSKQHSLKLALSTGAIVRVGSNFTTVSIGWQTLFLGKSKKTESKP